MLQVKLSRRCYCTILYINITSLILPADTTENKTRNNKYRVDKWNHKRAIFRMEYRKPNSLVGILMCTFAHSKFNIVMQTLKNRHNSKDCVLT